MTYYVVQLELTTIILEIFYVKIKSSYSLILYKSVILVCINSSVRACSSVLQADVGFKMYIATNL